MLTANVQLTLNALLREAERYGPTYGNGLSNHLPMVLIAMQRLGASSTELEAHVQGYAKRLEPVPASDKVISDDNLVTHLGDWSAYGALRLFFLSALEREDTQATLARYWPKLMPGIASAGFHALIRLAYGLEAGHRGEIASGLAYLASSNTPLLPSTIELPGKAENVAQALNSIHRAFAGRTIEANLIIEELQLATEEPDFFAALLTPPLASKSDQDRTLADMAHQAIRIYLGQPNFNSLHLVTGTHALAVVLPHLPEPLHAESLFYFWVAFCAGYVTVGAPAAVEPAPSESREWATITKTVCQNGHDHDIKLVYTCHSGFLKTQDPAYLAAAMRLV